eukprot:122245_1
MEDSIIFVTQAQHKNKCKSKNIFSYYNQIPRKANVWKKKFNQLCLVLHKTFQDQRVVSTILIYISYCNLCHWCYGEHWNVSTLSGPCVLPSYMQHNTILYLLLEEFGIQHSQEYLSLFERNGYTTIDSLKTLDTLEAIQSIGIWRLGHQKLMIRIFNNCKRSCTYFYQNK